MDRGWNIIPPHVVGIFSSPVVESGTPLVCCHSGGFHSQLEKASMFPQSCIICVALVGQKNRPHECLKDFLLAITKEHKINNNKELSCLGSFTET